MPNCCSKCPTPHAECRDIHYLTAAPLTAMDSRRCSTSRQPSCAVVVLLHLLNKQVVAVDEARGQSPGNFIGETHQEVRHTRKCGTNGIPVTGGTAKEGVGNGKRLMGSVASNGAPLTERCAVTAQLLLPEKLGTLTSG